MHRPGIAIFFVGVMLMLCPLRSSAGPVGDLSVRLDAPAQAPAWERLAVKIVIENKSGRVLLPISVSLNSDLGPIEKWGVDGPYVRWASMARARDTKLGWEVLWDPVGVSQQALAPPDDLDRAAQGSLLHLEPLAPGQANELNAGLDADYAHGERLVVKATYLVLDPQKLPVCRLADKPARRSFVSCKRVSSFGDGLSDLYLPLAELDKFRLSAEASAPLKIRHPEFDVDDARKLAKLPSGPFGYDLRGKRWILVDEPGRRTVLVGSSGAAESLPGNWLGPLVASNVIDGYSIDWAVRSPEEGTRLLAELGKLGIRADWMKFKGHLYQTRVVLEFRREDLPKLSRLMGDLGARMIRAQGVNYVGWGPR